MNNIDINDAAEVVMAAEKAALETIKLKLDALDTDLEAVLGTLPEKLSIDARRIVTEVRSALNYQRVTMIPMVLNKYAPEGEFPHYSYTAPASEA